MMKEKLEEIKILNDPIHKHWNDNYCQDFNYCLLNIEGLSNIIAFDVTSCVIGIKYYFTYGLRDHFVQLVKNIFPNEKANDKNIAA